MSINELKIRLTDPDNRNDRGAPFELRGTVARVIKYLDGPLRRDTREEFHSSIERAIAELKEGNLAAAANVAFYLGVNLTEITGELPEVIDLGEESDLWLVTGTSDAHSAEEAVRKHWTETMDEDTFNDMFDNLELGDLGLEYRSDWAWKHPEGWPPDREPEDDSRLVCGDEGNGLPRFAGFMVTL